MGGTLAGVSEEQRTAILRSVSDILILEIQKTFDFFRATASGENIRRIFVAGGTARVPGLAGSSERGICDAGRRALSVSKDRNQSRESR